MEIKKFKIEYKDPDSGEIIQEAHEFNHTEDIPAEIWAEDYAYARSQKGWYHVKEIA